MDKAHYLISDAAHIVNVESHVLRYWEDELELDVPRNELGHRYYTKENIQEFQRIKELKEQGYQLKAIRMIVHNGPLDEFPPETEEDAIVKKDAVLQSAPDRQSAPGKPVTANKPATEDQSSAGGAGSSAILPIADPPVRAPQYPQNVKNRETPQSILDNTDRMAQFTDLMTQIVGKALAANNEELSQNISDEVGKQVIKEMNYLMREREELEEERFRKLDAAIRGNMRKKEEEKGFWKKRKPSQP